ncbi:DUF4424 family protein [uncultured Alsobacter sp.]|uniref:DUF4424 family protein n=1 Tax=uncultured Alsobacter sp. TaxID=1748258 RepID=UPI0025E45BCD|nr:DUF4424 family protein [uncultured Alsobacter sp.]
MPNRRLPRPPGWRLLLAGVALVMACGPGLAQESSTELPLGGLTLVPAGDAAGLSIQSAQMQVTPDRVTIRYSVANTGGMPLDAKLVLALPRLDFSDPDVQWAIPGIEPTNFIDAVAKVDGRPLRMAASQTADLNGRSVAAELRRSKISLVPVGTFQNEVQALQPKALETLAGAGVIQQAGTSPDGAPLYFPTWAVETVLSAPVKIPADKPLALELSYRTSVGVSRDTVLRKALREKPSLAAPLDALKRTYCIDAGTLAGIDKLSAAGEANGAQMEERRIRVLLQPLIAGKPTGVLKLSVDKGRPDRITSFCSQGVKKTGPTTFQSEARDVVEPLDFRILLVGPR